jgi:hypothetical protein
MKKLSIVLAGFLFVAGFFSTSWAQGPKGGGSGYRGHGHSKPHYSRPSHSRIHSRHNQHYRHKGHNKHYRHKGHKRHHRHYRQGRYYWPYYGPYGRYYEYGYEDDPPIEESQVPQHSPSSHIYYNKNPEPWFLYGKGKEFRQMGLIPPLSQTQGLR